MIELKRSQLCKASEWEKAGVRLPAFDLDAMAAQTAKNPVWLHFGAGNIFRGFIAVLQQTLLERGDARCGIVAAETFDYDIIDQIYRPHDGLTLLVNLKADGTTDKRIVASVADSIRGDLSNPAESARLRAVASAASLQLMSFTITEKGYALRDLDGNLFPAVQRDLAEGPDRPRHTMSVVAALLYARYRNGAAPLALVSMDNCSHNGEKLRNAVVEIARAWRDNGLVESGFAEYVEDEGRVAFPWTMIDKITPRPAREVQALLEQAGIAGMNPMVTSKNTYIAPFVNAEVPQYLVAEDRFPNGRPPLEKAGVYLTDRKTVNDAERMKVTTCLNPLHTALAVFGCLLGYDSIAAEMRDPQLAALVEAIAYREGLPVVTHPGIIDPRQFVREVLNERFPNPYIPDTPQRIACDTSQKMAIRFGETIRAYIEREDLNPGDLTFIPLVIAGWCRYLLGVDDRGEPFSPSADPMLAELQQLLAGVTLGRPESCAGRLEPILSNQALFGVDLYACGLAPKVESMLREMLAGPGAVRETLAKHLEK